MIRSDRNFVTEQLASSGYAGTLVGVFIRQLVDLLDQQEFESDDNADLNGWVEDALRLYRGQPIVTLDDRDWVDFQLGEISIRDTVRVKPDAYVGGYARNHNGKVGRVIGMQGRKISVAYEDKTDQPMTPILHEHTALQKLVK